MTVDCYDFADIWGTEEFSNWSVPQRAPDMKQDQAKQTKLSMKKVQIENYNVHAQQDLYEDGKVEWMNYASDSAHFRRRKQESTDRNVFFFNNGYKKEFISGNYRDVY